MTRTPGILLPKQARYQLRYTPIVIKLWLCKWSNLWSDTVLTAIFCFPYRPKIARLKGFLRFSLSCGANTVYAPKAGALPTALHPVIKLNYPAGRILPKQARYQLRSPPEMILFSARLLCSPGLRSTITPTVYWIFRRKSTGPPPKEKGETSCEASPFGKCFAVLPAGITWHPLPPCGR